MTQMGRLRAREFKRDLTVFFDMASPDDILILKVFVIDGRGFSFSETQALNLSCTFGSVTLETPYSINRENHLWNSELKWKVTRQQLRKLSS
jgi:centrosomal protein CEP120